MFSPLADAVRDTACFANAYTNTPLVIANNDDGAEGEATATLDYFGDALNIDNTFVEFFAIFFTITGFLVTITLRTVITTACALATGFIAAGLVATWSVAAPATLLFLWLICHFSSTLKF
jgi:hypothetical protein